jgi:formamidopyrimidine-DNA glycosylase
MPELPEVETVVRDLRPLLLGRTITAVHVSQQKLRRGWQPDWTALVLGSPVQALQRRGKWILMAFQSPTRLLVHLGMTGQFTVQPRMTPLASHTHLRFDLDHANDLRFRDIRRFGSVDLFPTEADLQAFLAERLGPEPEEMMEADFLAALQRTQRTLKAVLLDQSLIAGVGNIYADEALHRAKLNPEQRANSLQARQSARLLKAVQEVIRRAIEQRGSTIRDYVGGSGLRGGFQNEFAVYGRTGEPCLACQTPITMVRVAGRSSHFCPRCQPG